MGSLAIFMVDADAVGWLERRLSHSNSLTRILATQTLYGDRVPHAGDRVPQFNNQSEDAPTTHWALSDWLVFRVDVFKPVSSSGVPENDVIYYCYCVHDPIVPEWQELSEAQPISEPVAV